METFDVVAMTILIFIILYLLRGVSRDDGEEPPDLNALNDSTDETVPFGDIITGAPTKTLSSSDLPALPSWGAAPAPGSDTYNMVANAACRRPDDSALYDEDMTNITDEDPTITTLEACQKACSNLAPEKCHGISFDEAGKICWIVSNASAMSNTSTTNEGDEQCWMRIPGATALAAASAAAQEAIAANPPPDTYNIFDEKSGCVPQDGSIQFVPSNTDSVEGPKACEAECSRLGSNCYGFSFYGDCWLHPKEVSKRSTPDGGKCYKKTFGNPALNPPPPSSRDVTYKGQVLKPDSNGNYFLKVGDAACRYPADHGYYDAMYYTAGLSGFDLEGCQQVCSDQGDRCVGISYTSSAMSWAPNRCYIVQDPAGLDTTRNINPGIEQCIMKIQPKSLPLDNICPQGALCPAPVACPSAPACPACPIAPDPDPVSVTVPASTLGDDFIDQFVPYYYFQSDDDQADDP